MKFKNGVIVALLCMLSTAVFSQKNIKISGGSKTSCFVADQGKLFSMGNNSAFVDPKVIYGLLGSGGSASLYASPQEVVMPDSRTVLYASCGTDSHFVALTCDSLVWAWGINSSGQLGIGSKTGIETSPVQVKAGVLTGTLWDDGNGNLARVKRVYAGGNNSFAILSDGRVVSWGRNSGACAGQLGDGTTKDKLSAVLVKIDATTDLTNVIALAVGDNVTYALVDTDGDGIGTVYSWGYGQYGKLGRSASGLTNPSNEYLVTDSIARTVRYVDNSIMNNIKDIAAGDIFGAALDMNGYVWTWGQGSWNNATGNTTTNENSSAPKKVLKGSTIGASNDGVYLLAKSISGGQGFGMAVTIDGKPVAWGGGGVIDGGGFNNGSKTGTEYITYATNEIHTDVIAIYRGEVWGFYERNDGSLWAWGANNQGQLGIGATSTEAVQATLIALPNGVEFSKPLPYIDLTPKSYTTCASSFTSVTLNSGFSTSASLAPFYSIEWFKDGSLVKSGTALSDTTYIATSPGTYKVVISYDGANVGCANLTAQAETTISTWTPSFTVLSNLTYCSDTAIVRVNSSLNSNPIYNWYSSLTSTTPLASTKGANSATISVVDVAAESNTNKIVYVEEASYASGMVLKKAEGCDPTWISSTEYLSGPTIDLGITKATGFTVLEPVEITELSSIVRSSIYTVGNEGTINLSYTIYGSKFENGNVLPDNTKKMGTLVANYSRKRATEPATFDAEITAIGTVKLVPGSYFIAPSSCSTSGSITMAYLGMNSCNLNTTIVDDISGGIIKANLGVVAGGISYISSSGYVFNIKFQTAQRFCDRIPVVLSQFCPTCVQPAALTIVSNDLDSTLCPGGSLVLTSNTQANTTDFDFTWYKETVSPANIVSGPIENVNKASTLQVTNATAGTYILLVRDKLMPAMSQCYRQATFQIKNAPSPTAILSGGGSFEVSEITSPVSIGFTGTPPFTVSYIPDNVTKVITTSPYTIPNSSVEGTFEYQITAISDKYCMGVPSSNTVTLELTPNTLDNAIITSNSPLCAGSTLQLSSTSITGATYSWIGPNGFTSSEQNPVLTNVTTSMSGMYIVTISVAGNAKNLSTTLVVNALPTMPVVNDYFYCKNSVAPALTATTSLGASLVWYSNAIGGVGSSVAPTPNTALLGVTDYYVSQTKNGCESQRDTISVSITNTLQPTIVANPGFEICSGSNMVLSVVGGQFTQYIWSGTGVSKLSSTTAAKINFLSNDASTTTYTINVNAMDASSCMGAASATITVKKPEMPITITSKSYCKGEFSTPLSATGTNIRWYTAATGGTYSTTAPTPSTYTPSTTDYYVSQVENSCESARQKIIVTVKAITEPPTISPAIINYCKDSASVALSATGTDLQWYVDASGGIPSSVAPIPTTSINQTTFYYVSQTLNGCESNRNSIAVTVNSCTSNVLVSSVTVTPHAKTLNIGEKINLVATVLPTNASISTLTWVSSNQSIATVNTSGLVTAVSVGDAIITATANDGSGKIATCEISVTTPITKIVQPIVSISALAGNVYSEIEKYDLQAITSLTITGNIDARDFRILKDSLKNIEILNISACTINAYTGTDGSMPDKNIVYPANQIPTYAFSFAYDKMQTVYLPNSATSIGEQNFSGFFADVVVNQVNLKEENGILYNKDKTIVYFCDRNKSGEVVLPSTVTEISSCAFYNCIALTSVKMSEGVEKIGDQAFYQCEKLTALQLPSTVIHIGFNAFMNCHSVSGKLILPASLEYIDFNAFVNCWNVTDEIVVPDKVKFIGMNAFGNCAKVTSITLPASLDSIGGSIIYNANIQKLTVTSKIPLDFTNTPYILSGFSISNTTLYVPAGTKSLYQQAIAWKDFINIVEESYFELQTTNPTLQASQGSSTNVDVSTNTSWIAVSTQDWLTVTPLSPVVGNGTITLYASKNIGPARKANLILSATGLLPQTITVIQADSIAIISNIANITIDKQHTSETYFFANYFNFGGSSDIEYQVVSSNNAVAKPILFDNKFSIIPYAAGKVTFTVTATSKAGISTLLKSEKQATFTFDVTVTSSQSSLCGTIILNETITPVTCNGNDNGSISVQVSGGKTPYTYKWSNSRTDNFIQNITAGSYSLIVTDSMGCVASETYQVTQAQAIEIQETISNPSCGNNDGTISIAISGGAQPYTNLWSTGNISTQITNLGVGVYSVTVTDSKSCKQQKVFELNNSSAPEISIDSIQESPCNAEVGKIMVSVSGGEYPYSYLWNDQIQSKNRINLAPGTYTLQVIDALQCTSTLQIQVPQTKLIQPTIALVTVGNESGKNLIVWQKEESNLIDFYTIYRETTSAYQYEPIGTVSYSQTSIFKDENANSNIQSWRYKISATDVCGNETELSNEHKTIHLQQNLGTQGTINLDWDSYEGIAFSSYVIYKLDANGGMNQWVKIPASITRYTDTDPSKTVQGYFVGIELPNQIDVNIPLLKSESGPFTLAMSNISEVETTVETLENSQFIVYPTVATNNVNVQNLSNDAVQFEVVLVNSAGEIVRNINATSNAMISIPLQGLAKGSYIVKIKAENKIISTAISVQ